jgi:serine protease Do
MLARTSSVLSLGAFFWLCISMLSPCRAEPAVIPAPAGGTAAPTGSPAPAPPATAAADGRYYSDSFNPLRDDVRAYERDPTNRYTYCIRDVGTYECLSYGSDGSLRRSQHQAVSHGTGFAYQADEVGTRLLTNQHVVDWPYVTDGMHHVDDVPAGCKLVNQKLTIVDNEDDEYEEDDIPLERLAVDVELDVAVVRAKAPLRLLPYRIGRAAALSAGDVVVVRGFPLGVFQAYNTGKVINTYDHDLFKQWDHVDFIIDAQLSSGNSGSPVLALNRRTGEYELVGVFHASYTRANSLNAVIAIDQLDELMAHLRPRTPQRPVELSQLPDGERRLRLQRALLDHDYLPYVALGPLLVRVNALGDGLVFEVYSKKFPLDDVRVALLLAAPTGGSGDRLSRAYFGNHHGYRAYPASELQPESVALVQRVVDRLYALAGQTLSYRQQSSSAPLSRQAVEQRTALLRAMARAAESDPELAQQLLDLATRRAPALADQALQIGEVYAQLQPAPVAPTPVAPALPAATAPLAAKTAAK